MRSALTAVLLAVAAMAAPAFAQNGGPPAVGQRVDRLEREMRAVQRKVFPGGDQQYFEAEIAPPQASGPAPGTPASTPVADLAARVDALERELARLTGTAEQNAFKLRQLEEALNRFKGDSEFRLNALEGSAPPPGGGAAPVVRPSPPSRDLPPRDLPPRATPPRDTAPRDLPPPRDTSRDAPPRDSYPRDLPPRDAPPRSTAPAGDSAAATGDAGEDAYMAGYRLWEAKRYPEAEAALKQAVAKYPSHRRASYAQNLLGRAYLDDGKPAAAAEAFYANYQKMPRGDRAPDSLYFLGQALVQLKKPSDACKVYDELLDVYGEKISAALKDRVSKGRTDARCQ